MSKLTWWGWLSLVFAIACVGAAVWLVHDRHWWATVFQVIGSVITAYGLASAYLRSKYDETLSQFMKRWVRDTLDRLHNRHRVGMNLSGDSSLAVSAQPTAGGLRGTKLTVEATDRVQLQIAQIVAHINNLTENRLPQIEGSISKVQKEIARVAGDLSAMDEKTRVRIEERITDFDKRLDAKQVLDLRWAIWGLLITTLGVLLSF